MIGREISTAEKLAEIRTERSFRSRVYERLIHQGKMTRAQADRRIAILDAIIADYLREQKAEAGGAHPMTRAPHCPA